MGVINGFNILVLAAPDNPPELALTGELLNDARKAKSGHETTDVV